jgi:hypothetical protein
MEILLSSICVFVPMVGFVGSRRRLCIPPTGSSLAPVIPDTMFITAGSPGSPDGSASFGRGFAEMLTIQRLADLVYNVFHILGRLEG